MTTPRTTASAPRIDPAWTVNEVVRRHPATIAVFNAFGLDACCGGANTLARAVEEAGADAGTILFALESVVRLEEGPKAQAEPR